MKNFPIEELFIELSFDGIRKDENTIEFHSPDGITITTAKLDQDFYTITLETKLYHSFNQVQGTIYTLSQELYEKYSDETIREIIEDIATQIKYILLPKIFKNLKKFELKETLDHESVFFYQIDYKDKPYEELKKEIYGMIDYSFKLILKIQEKIAEFIEKSIEQYLNNPKIEIKVLEIKKRLFQVQFYSSMDGRFSDNHIRKAKRLFNEAQQLYEEFKKKFPKEAKKRKDFLEMLFEKYKI
ncbi:MAG: hypothetical protein GF329_21900 [Candidatus Lokiarchaeota archaeon]|nr:hypothetical protein [Candidatus Lokiarchaeota archaeon]